MIKLNNISKENYKKLSEKACPPGKNFINYLFAFLIGGFICVIGQLLMFAYEQLGLSEDEIKMALPVTLIVISALLTALKVYHKIAKVAGAGTLVPITGFANAVVSPAMEFKTEGYILGTGVKMFAIAGPVIVYGTIAGALYGVIIYLLGVM